MILSETAKLFNDNLNVNLNENENENEDENEPFYHVEVAGVVKKWRMVRSI